MSDKTVPSALPEIEAERYEFFEGQPYHFEIPRRDFFKVMGGGILVLSVLNEALAQQRGEGNRRGRGDQREPQEIGAWIHIGEDGVITAFTGKVELGQNIRTSLAQAAAEELRVPVGAVRLLMADTDSVPYDMGTFGSRTTPTMSPQIRRAAAAARELLVDLAAAKWNVDRGALMVASGKVTDPASNSSVTFAELTKGQKLTKAITEVALTPTDQWKVLGTTVPKANGREFVTGEQRYASDIKLPDMLYGKVLRPVAFGATMTALDTKDAESIPGVTVVRDGEFAGVAAPNDQVAARALAALRAEWKLSPQPAGAELYEHLKRNASESRGGHVVGSIQEGLASANVKLE